MLNTAIVIFSRNKTRAWSGKKLTLILRSFLKLESFGYNNNNRDFVIHHYLRQRFGPWCKFLHAAYENCHGKKWLKKLIKGLYSQSEEDEHDKQRVYDTMYKSRWSLFQVLHTTLHCVKTIQKVRRPVSDFFTSTAGT